MNKTLCLSLLFLIVGFCASGNTSAVPETEVQTKSDSSITDRVISWYNQHLNYGTVTLLMTIESSFIPFPSEVVVPPAAYQACNEDNQSLYKTDYKIVNVLLVVLFATLGALTGALVNYFLALFLGRPIIYWFADSKVGHLLMLDSEKIKKAEAYFVKHGKSSTLIGRLIPAIRQLISIPAGLARMNLGVFVLFTSLGATLWNIILALLGYLAHGQQDLIDKYNGELKIALWGLCIAFVLYLVYKGVKSSRSDKKSAADTSAQA